MLRCSCAPGNARLGYFLGPRTTNPGSTPNAFRGGLQMSWTCGRGHRFDQCPKKSDCPVCKLERTRKWESLHPDRPDYKRKPRTSQFWTTRSRYRKTPGARANQKLVAQKRWLWLKAGDVTKLELEMIAAAANYRCELCGTPIRRFKFYTTDCRGFDHIIPMAKGGRHTASNIQVCCHNCNTKKHVRLVPTNEVIQSPLV